MEITNRHPAGNSGQKRKMVMTRKRIKYDRGDINSTMRAALKVSEYAEVYVYATAYGYIITDTRPPYGQPYYKVNDGKAEKHIPIYG